jgi:hypothetical protein
VLANEADALLDKSVVAFLTDRVVLIEAASKNGNIVKLSVSTPASAAA